MNRRCSSGISAAVILVAGLACSTAESKPSSKNGGPSGAARVQTESAGEVIISKSSTAYVVSKVTAGASVSGAISFKDSLAPQAPIPTGRDSTICGATISDQSLQKQGSAVVWLEGVAAGKAPGYERRLELESAGCKLSPRVQAAFVGSAVNVLGTDNLRQHLRFTASGEAEPRATILLGSGTQVIPTELPFQAPGLVVVRDADRAWTRAYLAVFDHPYFAVTSANGTFTIDGVPPGTYTLHAWHERTGSSSRPVTVGADGVVNLKLEL